MKLIPMLAAAALVFGVTAASAQTPPSGASKPGSTTNTDKEVPTTGTPANQNMGAGSGTSGGTAGSGASGGTMGAGSSATGTTGGSNPNPPSNMNPDKEVPGKKQ